MAKTQILEYTIHLRDAALVAQLQAQLAAGQGPGKMIVHPLGGWGILRSPIGAAEEFAVAAGAYPPALPILDAGTAPPAGGAGYLTSAWFTPGNGMDRNVAKFRRSTGWWIFGSETVFYWSGSFALAPSTTFDGETGTPLPIAERLLLNGFEQICTGDLGGFLGASGDHNRRTPAASRTGDGLGLRLTSTYTGSDAGRTTLRLTAGLRPAVTDVADLWARFYWRIWQLPSTATTFVFQALDSGGRGPGLSLAVTPAGQLELYGVQLSLTFEPVHTHLATLSGTLVLGQWMRVDLVLGIDGTTYTATVWVNGAPVGMGEFTATALSQQGFWDVVELGLGFSADDVSTDMVVDVDDYLLARGPVDPADLAQGSHLVRVVADGFGPAHDPSWTGDWRYLTALFYNEAIGNIGNNHLRSSVPDAVAEVNLPLASAVGAHPYSLGVASWRVIAASYPNNNLSASFGYQVGAGAPVLTPMIEATNTAYEAMTGTADGTLLPAGETLRLRYKNVSAANGLNASAGVYGLLAVVELRGSFGPEDVPPGAGALAFPRQTPLHLRHLPSTPWARDVLPMAPVITVGGTYTGLGEGNPVELVFPLPVAWLLVRGSTGVMSRWWPALSEPHDLAQGLIYEVNAALHMSRDWSYVPAGPDADQQMQFRVRLRGDNVTAAMTYEYVALLDPAGRFTQSAATVHRSPYEPSAYGPGLPWTWPLDDPDFQAEGAFGWSEVAQQTAPIGIGQPPLFWKSLGHPADALRDVGQTDVLRPDALTLGPGTFTIRPGLIDHQNIDNLGFFLWRRNDGNPDSNGRVLFAGSYVGNGAASQVITFGTVGRRPLYAMVGRDGTTAYHRDPMHTGTTSGNATGATINASTAIIAGGLDSFTVGITLNTTGQVFHYWGLYGSTAAGNGGWSTNGDYVIPADSTMPPDWEEPVEVDGPVDPGPDPGGPGTDPGDPGSDIFAECVEASTRIVNLALSEIGITKRITSLATDVSQEADAARTIYRTLVDTVLREDDWAFTREYATLTALAGSPAAPVNPDWTYSYTLPADCLRVKRICNPAEQRRYSTEPIPFDRRSANLGQTDLLLTNEPGGGLLPPPTTGDPVTVTIEYAKRISCPARVTDAKFRECLVFRLAAGLAKALARDSADADRCMRNYLLARPSALVQQANDTEVQRPSTGLPGWTTGR